MKEIVLNSYDKTKMNLLLTSYKDSAMRYIIFMKMILKQQSIL
ncbi:Uncharacterised protein [Raoultella terrigena]|uniref:Uncharacterized protein n=1 Tax=Raoultella terrigena TaxID=577 RepID=A0A485BYV6_RAOTE|nr:Uncharacterised protein [Raoultella terrigena]